MRRRDTGRAALKGAVVAFGVGLAVGGCVLGGEEASGGGTRGQAAGREGAGKAPGVVPEKALGSRETSAGRNRLKVTLTSLAREGGLATVNFTATVLEAADTSGWQVSDYFGSGTPPAPGGSTDLTNGVFLIDGENKKRHLVATDANRNCVCSSNLSATFVGQGRTLVLTATFAAPPANVDAVDVAIPHAGTFRDVPLG